MDKSYPEHEKLKAVKDRAELIGEFVDWLGDRGYVISEFIEESKYPMPTRLRAEDYIARFFELDRDKLEAEKREMLSALAQIRGERP